MDLKDIRKRIDAIDHEMLGLLTERMEMAMQSKKHKSEIKDEVREAQVLDRARRYSRATAAMPKEFVEKMFGAILEESRRLQGVGGRLVGFQGEHGAYSEEAAGLYDQSLVPVPCTGFNDVFDGVENGSLDLGIVPVENSSAGPVIQVGPLLAGTPLRISGGLRFQVDHCLMKLPETDYRSIRKIYSHPQALAQCRDFLARHEFEGVPFYDTAGAARMLAVERPAMSAVLAGRRCADLYGLEVLKENVQDIGTNVTRFVLLSKEERTEGADTCSLIFTVPHKAGALFDVLKIFAERGLNLTRIESFPSRDGKGGYSFFLDFQSEDIVRVSGEVLKMMEERTATLKCLGRYRELGPE